MDNQNLPTFTYLSSFQILDFLYLFSREESLECILEIRIDFGSTLEFIDASKYWINEHRYITKFNRSFIEDPYLELDINLADYKPFTVNLFTNTCIKRIEDVLSQSGIITSIQSSKYNGGATRMVIQCRKPNIDFQNRILNFIEKLLERWAFPFSLSELRGQIWNRILAHSEANKIGVIPLPYTEFNGLSTGVYFSLQKDDIDIFEVDIPQSPIILFGYYFLLTDNLTNFTYNSEYLYFTINPDTANFYEWQEGIVQFYQSTGKVFIDGKLQGELSKETSEYKFLKVLFNKPNFQFSGSELIQNMSTGHITQTPGEYLKKVKSKLGKELGADILKYIVTEKGCYKMKT